MRLKKKEALEQAQKNLEKRTKLLEGAKDRYNKALERVRKAEFALSKPTEVLTGSMSTGTWNVDYAADTFVVSKPILTGETE
jgi:hypothetical protein